MLIKDLLNSMLSNPSRVLETENQIFLNLNNREACEDYKELIRTNFTLAFMFLYKLVNHSFFSTEDFQDFLIDQQTGKHGYYVSKFFRRLSVAGNVSRAVVDRVVERERIDILDGICMKFREQDRSDELFIEIMERIEAMGEMILKQLREFKGSSELYSLLYSLLYQDIHPLFEDHLDILFPLLAHDYANHRQEILALFQLFLTKYPELVDYALIISAITVNMQSTDFSSVFIVDIVTKAYRGLEKSQKLGSRNLLLQYVDQVLADDRLLTEDFCAFTVEMLSLMDRRGQVAELIKSLKPTRGEVSKYFYCAGVLKLRDEALIAEAAAKLTEEPPQSHDQPASGVFDLFFYLISLNIPVMPHISYFHGSSVFYYAAAKLAVVFFRANFFFHSQALLLLRNISLENTLDKQNLSKLSTCVLERVFSANKVLDSFTVTLLLELEKACLIPSDSKSPLSTLIYYNLMRLERITDSSTIAALFDIFMLLDRDPSGSHTNDIFSLITSKELTDVYHLLFYFIAHQIDKVDPQLVVLILSENSFYEDSSLHPSLAVLVLSAFSARMLSSSQVLAINSVLRSFYLAYATGVEDSYYIDNNIVSHSESSFLFSRRISSSSNILSEYFSEKYSRIILRKMAAVDPHVVSNERFHRILLRNKTSVEKELTLVSIIKKFHL